MRAAVQRGAVVAPSSLLEKRQMGVCVCVNVLSVRNCEGIVEKNLSVFSPQRERYFHRNQEGERRGKFE